MLESVIQRNILMLEYHSPASFKDQVYTLLESYSKLELPILYNLMEMYSKEMAELDFFKSGTKTISDLYKEKLVDELSLLAKVNALSMLLAVDGVEYKKPISWWKDVSLQLIDVSVPASDTVH